MTVASDQKSKLITTARKQFQERQYKQAKDTCLEILELQQDHQDALIITGLAALKLGTANTAELYLREALRLLPDDANLHCNIGIALAMQCELERAEDAFRRAVDLQPNYSVARTHLEQAIRERQRISNKIQLADDANMVPTVTLSDEEREIGSPKRQTANDATSLFRHFGYLIVENLFETTYIEGVLDYFRKEYPQFYRTAKGSTGIEVSDRRSLTKIPIDGAFKDPAFYAPELLYPILTQLLGDRFIMLTLGAVVSRPGAQEQRIHSDHSPLFDAQELNRQVPPFAITVATPLIDMNGVTGTTRMYDKTHLRTGFLSETEKQHYIEPEISVGSVLLFDYRLQHCGTANRSTNVRPLVCGVYGRPWFRDAANYFRQEALLIPDEVYAQTPERYRKLFEWTRYGVDADKAS
jgi:ectoine hydroxylase-related dioxygenase (phytanoyl-CoA dioxygenase family)